MHACMWEVDGHPSMHVGVARGVSAHTCGWAEVHLGGPVLPRLVCGLGVGDPWLKGSIWMTPEVLQALAFHRPLSN